MKSVYLFEDAAGLGRDLLGGKGYSLANMTEYGLRVPPGFVITTDVCRAYLKLRHLPEDLPAEIDRALAEVESRLGRRLGDPERPLLLAVRSGAAVSMPGMMDTVLNLGLNAETRAGLERMFNERFAFDAHRRFLESFGSIVLEVDPDRFAGAARDVPADDPHAQRDIVNHFLEVIYQECGLRVPEDPREQLNAAIEAVFRSWNTPRARSYRQLHDIPEDLGTAVTVQAMVFGNLDGRSGTGVAFTRDPNTGERAPYGDFLYQAQGEDVVSGRHSTLPLSALGERLPEVDAELQRAMELLEQQATDMCDIEFTVEAGNLYLLQVRRGKRAAVAAVRIAVELAEEGLISREEAVRRISAEELRRLERPHLDPTADNEVLTTGLGASPGVASGHICLTADDVHDFAATGEPVILVRPETSPNDIHGMAVADGILTTRGGLVSHAAIVARELGTPAVVGAAELVIDMAARSVQIGEMSLHEGDLISIDGGTGEVVAGEVARIAAQQSEYLETLLTWVDELAGDTDGSGSPVERLQRAHQRLAEIAPTSGDEQGDLSQAGQGL